MTKNWICRASADIQELMAAFPGALSSEIDAIIEKHYESWLAGLSKTIIENVVSNVADVVRHREKVLAVIVGILSLIIGFALGVVVRSWLL